MGCTRSHGSEGRRRPTPARGPGTSSQLRCASGAVRWVERGRRQRPLKNARASWVDAETQRESHGGVATAEEGGAGAFAKESSTSAVALAVPVAAVTRLVNSGDRGCEAMRQGSALREAGGPRDHDDGHVMLLGPPSRAEGLAPGLPGAPLPLPSWFAWRLPEPEVAGGPSLCACERRRARPAA
jgi:hypothetical protein